MSKVYFDIDAQTFDPPDVFGPLRSLFLGHPVGYSVVGREDLFE